MDRVIGPKRKRGNDYELEKKEYAVEWQMILKPTNGISVSNSFLG